MEINKNPGVHFICTPGFFYLALILPVHFLNPPFS